MADDVLVKQVPNFFQACPDLVKRLGFDLRRWIGRQNLLSLLQLHQIVFPRFSCDGLMSPAVEGQHQPQSPDDFTHIPNDIHFSSGAGGGVSFSPR